MLGSHARRISLPHSDLGPWYERAKQVESEIPTLVVSQEVPLLTSLNIKVVLPNGHSFALIPQSVLSVEPLEMSSDRADGNPKVSSDLLVRQSPRC